MSDKIKSVPSVSVTYARNGASTKANALGMRPMQERASRVRQLRAQVLVFARSHFQKCHYNSANCSGAAGFSIPKA